MRLTDAACFYAALDQFDRGISEDRADREVRHSLRIRRVPAEDLERLVQDVAMERARLRNRQICGIGRPRWTPHGPRRQRHELQQAKRGAG